MGMYAEGLRRLVESGLVFACSCSRAKILRMRADGVYPGTCRDRVIMTGIEVDGESWRLRTGEEEMEVRELDWALRRQDEEGKVKTGGGGTTVEVVGDRPGVGMKQEESLSRPGPVVLTKREGLPDAVKDFIVRKKDGFPAYQLTSVIDDLYYGVDLVVRGQDLWASTLAQHYLASIGGMDLGSVTFFHHPLLLGTSGVKLSKSAGDTSVRYLRSEGLRKEDVFIRLGGLLGLEQPARSWEELAKALLG